MACPTSGSNLRRETALETLGFVVDPIEVRLIPGPGMLYPAHE
jgi:hypothetical protein